MNRQPDEDALRALYFEAISLARTEGFEEESRDFAGWIIEQALTGAMVEEPLLQMLRKYRFEKLELAQQRRELKLKIQGACGRENQEGPAYLSIMVRREKLIALAKDGVGIPGIARALGVTPKTAERLLFAAKTPGEWVTLLP